jgi:hypothetical protein
MDEQAISDPAQTLTEVRRLRVRSRRLAHGGAWVPAAVLTALVLLSALLYRYPLSYPQTLEVRYPFWAGLPDEQRSPAGSYAFWLLGLPAAFGVIAAWYRYRARRLGVRVAWPVLAAVGLGALVLLLVLVAIPSEPVTGMFTLRAPLWKGLITPLVAVAAGLIALGWVERAPTLAAAGVWFGLAAWWQCATGMLGAIPGWLVWVLSGGSGPALGGQSGGRPGGMLLAMVLPLLVWIAVRAVRSRGGPR